MLPQTPTAGRVRGGAQPGGGTSWRQGLSEERPRDDLRHETRAEREQQPGHPEDDPRPGARPPAARASAPRAARLPRTIAPTPARAQPRNVSGTRTKGMSIPPRVVEGPARRSGDDEGPHSQGQADRQEAEGEGHRA